ncbi:MCE family protein [Antrihabitans cavernicola]|uniref:MCE family protein n=1 Tax=Antrihabitans cavernicola TaxID=2495913 RepID=A0A5A7S652_9NOCA|nr:MCE family protein [Spelaeibacter cavernicola]KAA0020205.1 MCE family protein [Spelaeibacter cavernicola]
MKAHVGRQRLLGLAFFLIVILFVGYTIGQYNKAFTKVVKVNLVTDTTGNQLPTNADVKVRGLIVGEVRSSTTENGKVTSVLALNPDKAKLIPSNVTARLLPKTLFGQRYVALQLPKDDKASPIQAGSTIQQDVSGNAVEVGKLLDGLLPLLQAIPPAKLATTLGSLSQGLSGRGEELGQTLDRLGQIVGGVNNELPNLTQGIRGLADFSQTYSDAAPELIDALDSLRTTGNTVVQQQDQIRSLVSSLTTTGATTADFLEANRDSVISIAADSKDALQTLAKYSGTFGCTFAQFVPIVGRASAILGLDENGNPGKYPGARANAMFVNPRGRYLPNQDEPRLLDDRGPRCYQPAPAGQKFGQYPGGSLNDGSYQPPSRNPGPADVPELPAPQYSVIPGAANAQPAAYAGSKFEENTLALVYSKTNGMAPQEVPGWTTLMGAPAMRGMEVTVK